MSRICALTTSVVLFLGAGPLAAANLGDTLDGRLRGAWAVLEIEVYSSCSGTYSDNRVGGAGVSSKASRRFEPGELVKIDKIKVKRSRVDLLVTLAEPILVSRMDGPFELWEKRECKAQLIFEFPRTVIKTGDADAVFAVMAFAFSTSPSRAAAEGSDAWNGRKQQPYPEDYEQTLARYEVWRATQTNAAVTAAIATSTSEAASVAEDIESNGDYLDGFAAGAEKMRSVKISDCDAMLDASFSSHKKRPPSDMSASFDRGFDDGQSLVFHLRLARDLRKCFVPVPAVASP